MMQRAPRYPPLNARLIRLEEGPPMYRMLGYVDRSNVHYDLTDPKPPGYFGPFSGPRLAPNQTLPIGPGRFGLPAQPLAFTTLYWDGRADECIPKEINMRIKHLAPETRPEAEIFPEMAVPGSGVVSKYKNSGYVHIPGIAPPYWV